MKKPTVKNPDGNIFAILGATQSALRRAGQTERLEDFRQRVEKEKDNPNTSYHAMLGLCMEYVDFEIDEPEDEEDGCWEDEDEESEDE